MIWILVLLAAAAALAYHFREPLLAFVKSKVAKPTVAQPATPVVVNPGITVAPFDFKWHLYAGMTLGGALIYLHQRGFSGNLTPQQIEDAKAAGVIVPESAPIGPNENDKPGFELEMNGARKRNRHEAGVALGYHFQASGSHQLAWSCEGSGGMVKTWITTDSAASLVDGTEQEVLNGSAGQTYYTGHGPRIFWLQADRSFVFKVEAKKF